MDGALDGALKHVCCCIGDFTAVSVNKERTSGPKEVVENSSACWPFDERTLRTSVNTSNCARRSIVRSTCVF